MAFDHKENSGSLFKNGYKTEDKHPDHQGECKIKCPSCGTATVFRISAWINDLKNSTGKYFGMNFSIPKPKEQSSPTGGHVIDDDIPF